MADLPERSYDGDAVDMTAQYVSERPYGDPEGETVGGSTPADEGAVETSEWPDGVDADPEDLTGKQAAAIRAAAKFPGKSMRELGEIAGSTGETVRRTLEMYWPERHKQAVERHSNTEQGEQIAETQAPKNQTDEPVTPREHLREAVREAVREHPELTPEDLRDVAGRIEFLAERWDAAEEVL